MKESAHNLRRRKRSFFSIENTYNYENLWKNLFEHSAIFRSQKNSPTFFFESFLERLLTNLSLKFELTQTMHPILLGGEAIKVNLLPQTD